MQRLQTQISDMVRTEETPRFAETSEDHRRLQPPCDASCNQVPIPSESGALRHIEDAQTLIQERGWTALVHSQHAENLKQHCCLCGRWIVGATALKRHIKGAHKDLWSKHQPQIQSTCAQLQHTLKRDQACQYCGRVAHNRHYFQCCVLFQAALLGLIQNDQHVDCKRADQHVRASHAQPCSRSTTTGIFGETNILTDGSRTKGASRQDEQGSRDTKGRTEEIISLMARLIIQHEDQLGLSRMDRAFTLFMEQAGPTGVLSNLYQAGVEWNQNGKIEVKEEGCSC